MSDTTASAHTNATLLSSLTSKIRYEKLLDSDLDDTEEIIAMPKLIVSKQIVQNPKDINLDEDSDDEWNPSREEEEILDDEIKTVRNRKSSRKQNLPQATEPNIIETEQTRMYKRKQTVSHATPLKKKQKTTDVETKL